MAKRKRPEGEISQTRYIVRDVTITQDGQGRPTARGIADKVIVEIASGIDIVAREILITIRTLRSSRRPPVALPPATEETE